MSPGAAHHARAVLEFVRVLERVAGRAGSPAGRDRVLALEPCTDVETVRVELARVDAVRAFLGERPDAELPAVPAATGPLARLAAPGVMLEGTEIRTLGVLLAASGGLRRMVEGADVADDLIDRLLHVPELEQRIDREIAPDGSVRDNASRELARIRRSLNGTRGEVVRALERFASELPERWQVGDASVTLRAGRYVIPVRREARSAVGGIVHDESATGGTLFVEPPAAIERMNRMRELEAEELREVRRILRATSDALAPHREGLQSAWAALAEFDSRVARARCAADWDAHVPEVFAAVASSGEADRIEIVSGRHPLLIESGEPPVPFSLTLEETERTVVVSGPNTGGKTVLLKALGLLPMLTAAGVVPPLGPGSRVPIFRAFFADIGDEQSIAHSLSTFSAHLGNLRAVLEDARTGDLVLLDEMGTGTDPAEGAALAQAILEELTRRGARCIATSHLGQLKRLDAPGSGIVNASLQFDTEGMQPTFRLVKDRPGRSYGLAIARRLGFPETVLARAEELVEDSEAAVERLLERLEADEAALGEALAAAERDRDDATRLREDWTRRDAELRDAERKAERTARKQARQLLLDARAEVEEAIRVVRSASADVVEEKASAARRQVEASIALQDKELKRSEAEVPASGSDTGVEVGATVRVGSSGGRGRVVALEGHRATVELDGGLRVHVGAADLVPSAAPERPRAGGGWSAPDIDASPEVDLRGLRLEEVETPLRRALDDAILADLPTLRVIHGKGTGALRARVQVLLEEDPRVLDLRSGGDGEGGSGVTVVRLR